MIPDFNQNTQISDARSRASDAKREARQAHAEVQRLTSKVDALNLTCQALWELLKECSDLTDDDLATRIREIDLRDGAADGRNKVAPVDCPTCNRPINIASGKCMYCGHVAQFDPFGNPSKSP